MKQKVLISPLLISLLLLAACTQPPAASVEPELPRAVFDHANRLVRLPEKVERIVSLAPNLTEMVYATGAGDRLVGVTTFCNYPPEAGSIAKVGDTQTPNIESIVALKPDIVLVSTDSQLEAFMNVLGDQKLPVYLTRAEKFEDIPDSIRRLGEVFGTEERANKIADQMLLREQAVIEKLAKENRPSVFVQISNEPLFTIGKTSFLTEVIERAGGISMTSGIESAYPKLSKETASLYQPDVIILSDSEDNREPNDVFKNSPAVKNGRVYRVNADLISRPGPRIVDGLEQIAAALHPKLKLKTEDRPN